jgi:hypothetical protein
LAWVIASSIPSTGMISPTGPKISSRAIVAWLVPAKTVGSTK